MGEFMDNRTEQALIQLRDDLVFFSRRTQEVQTALQTLMAQAGIAELRIGVIPPSTPAEHVVPNKQ